MGRRCCEIFKRISWVERGEEAGCDEGWLPYSSERAAMWVKRYWKGSVKRHRYGRGGWKGTCMEGKGGRAQVWKGRVEGHRYGRGGWKGTCMEGKGGRAQVWKGRVEGHMYGREGW